MAAAGVPTGRSYACTTQAEVAAALDEFGPPYVVKNDGLAAGKGVVVTDDRADALGARARLRPGRHRGVSSTGPRCRCSWSPTATAAVPLMPAQDFKRVGDGDAGPEHRRHGRVRAAALGAGRPGRRSDGRDGRSRRWPRCARRGTPFAGLLYVGLALTADGPRVIEFNARFGDPETQVVLALLDTPLAGLLHAAATGTLAEHPPLRWHDGAAVTVVVASHELPGHAAHRRRDHRRRPARRDPRRHRPPGRRRAGLRRRPGAQRDRHRAGPGRRPRRRLRPGRRASRWTAPTTAPTSR